jgi:hypothetical protein
MDLSSIPFSFSLALHRFISENNIARLPASILAEMSGYVLIPVLTGVTDRSISTFRIYCVDMRQMYGA